MIEVLSNGALNLIQDQGRTEYLALGVSIGGAMDSRALVMANWMLGNDGEAAGIEISIFPFRVQFHRSSWFACTGATTTVKIGERRWPSWWAARAQPGEVLTVAAPSQGSRAYLAFSGGLDVPVILGSRSTDLKSRFGGYKGRGLAKGDRIGLCRSEGTLGDRAAFGIASKTRIAFSTQLESGTAEIRVIAGAEFIRFTNESAKAFQTTDYRLTPDCNRQGFRLDGMGLKTRHPVELLSHGIVPGTVQVPPSGQPIIQMTEANTCGGYPKIATVIEADLWRVAQLRPGQRIRFRLVDHNAACHALSEQADEQERIRRGLAVMVNSSINALSGTPKAFT